MDANVLTFMADLAPRWGVTPNTVSRRLSFLGIKPIRQGNFRFLTTEQTAQAQALQDHILAGRPMETFPRPNQKEGSPVVRQVRSKEQPGSELQAAALISAITAAVPQPPSDPFRRARLLAEAADSGLTLTTDELKEAGVAGVDRFADGDEALGYRFCKHAQRNRVLWSVERAIVQRQHSVSGALSQPLSVAGEDRCGGFDVAA